MSGASESWKRQFAPGAFGETVALPTLISNFWPPELEKNKFLLSEANKFVVICYGSHGKLTQLAKCSGHVPALLSTLTG